MYCTNTYQSGEHGMEFRNHRDEARRTRFFYYPNIDTDDFPALSCGEIHIWFVAAGDNSLMEQSAVLSGAEQAAAAQYKHAGARACYQAGHTALRLLLARYLHVRAEELSFVCGEHGKPSLSNQNSVHFNISHSGDWIALAFARHTPIGVDIEHARDTRRTDLIVRRFFHPQEAAAYASLPEPEKQRFFYERWTAREAALKALGIGLTVETNAFLVESLGDGTMCIKDGPPGSERLVLTRIDCPDGYIGCVAFLPDSSP